MSSKMLSSVTQYYNVVFLLKILIVLFNIVGYVYASHRKFTYVYSVMRLKEENFQFVDMLTDAVLNVSSTINAINGLANLKFFMLMACKDLLKSHSKIIILLHLLAMITGVVTLLYMVNVDMKMVTYVLYKILEFICFGIAVSVFFVAPKKSIQLLNTLITALNQKENIPRFLQKCLYNIKVDKFDSET